MNMLRVDHHYYILPDLEDAEAGILYRVLSCAERVNPTYGNTIEYKRLPSVENPPVVALMSVPLEKIEDYIAPSTTPTPNDPGNDGTITLTPRQPGLDLGLLEKRTLELQNATGSDDDDEEPF